MHRKTSLCILFENINIFTFILSLNSIRKAKRLILFHPYNISGENKTQHINNIIIRIVKILNPAIEILDIDKEIFHPLVYINNYESETYVEDSVKQIYKTSSFHITVDIIGSFMIERIYKRYLLDLILPISQFYRYAKKIQNNNERLIIVPSHKDYFGIHRYFFNKNEFYVITKKSIYFFNKFIRVISKVLSTLFLLNGFNLFRGIGYHLVRRIGRIGRLKSKAGTGLVADIIMPLIWGFADNNKFDGRAGKVSESKKVDWDNAFIFIDNLDMNRVSFFFSDWTFTPAARIKQCERMDSRGIKYFDPAEFRIDTKQLLFILKVWLKMVKYTISNPKIFYEAPYLTDISGRIIYRFLEEMLFNNRVNYKVQVEWADYSHQSIMRTIVANLFNRTTVGIHHNAPDGPYGFPQIRYTYINRLCIFGNAIRRMFNKHWDVMDCHIIGIPRLDFGFKALRPDKIKELKTRYYERFGDTGKVVFITLPNPPKNVHYQIESRFEEFLHGLLKCCQELSSFRIVFRPRFASHWKVYCEYELMQKIEASNKSIMDMREFSTYEWLAISDLVITNSISTVSIEASRMGKKCFIFDSMALAEVVFKDYGKDLILKTAEDVFNAISSLFNNSKNLSCDWKRFADDYCAFMDGNNTLRFSDVICRGIG